MMVQTAPRAEAHFVITMAEHCELCGQFARSFGNDSFQRLEPFEEMVYVVSNHDRGWDAYDASPGLDPETRLPYSLVRTPTRDSIKTNTGSPDFNERHHAYCGVLSSMHTWGLYNRRYGFSQFVVRQRRSTSITVAEDFKPQIDAMLASEVSRQERLKAELAKSERTRGWVEDRHLFQNYKQLQFFDTLALYFNLAHQSERGEEVYIHVPRTAEEDTSVTLKSIGGGRYSLSPFPFAEDQLKVTCRGRYARPFAEGKEPDNLGAALRALSADVQTYTLLPA